MQLWKMSHILTITVNISLYQDIYQANRPHAYIGQCEMNYSVVLNTRTTQILVVRLNFLYIRIISPLYIGSYKTADLLSITVDCGNTTARVQWTADDDLSSDTPFILEYNCTNISNGELVRLM